MQSIEIEKKSFIDSVYLLSKSRFTVKSYNTGITNFEKFLIGKHQLDIESMITKLQNNEFDIYKLLQEFVINLNSKNVGIFGS